MSVVSLATFLYFAYGSNLLTERIHINNPSAVKVGIGKLKDFKLDFGERSIQWHGAVATITPETGSNVWGAIWELSLDNMASLDRQEAVHLGKYEAMNVTVEKPDSMSVECRTYKLVKVPTRLRKDQHIPMRRRPSRAYRDTIITGAEECGLPEDYIQQLRRIKVNVYNGTIGIPLRHHGA